VLHDIEDSIQINMEPLPQPQGTPVRKGNSTYVRLDGLRPLLAPVFSLLLSVLAARLCRVGNPDLARHAAGGLSRAVLSESRYVRLASGRMDRWTE